MTDLSIYKDQYIGPSTTSCKTQADLANAIGNATNNDLFYSSSSHRGPFLNTDTGTHIRSEYNRADYDFYRPSERGKYTDKDIMRACNNSYYAVGIIRNAIDLMSDFASQGIRLIHPNKKQERFYQKWFEKVKGKDRSERFLSQFYRLGNVVVERVDLKINFAEKEIMSAKGAIKPFSDPTIKRNVIPGRYIFHAPMAMEILSGQAAEYLGGPGWAVKFARYNTSKYGDNDNLGILALDDKVLREIERRVPEEFRPHVLQYGLIPIDANTLSIYHYKKDDWDIWGKSMLHAIMSDVITYQKMQLADNSALDGAISSVRVWTLGDIENKIAPTAAGLNRLSNMLANNIGGGTIDLVWTPDIKFEETSSSSWQFLGPQKYEPVLNAIYNGLGIPPILIGGGSSGSGTSANNGFISLKVLQERLQYGRDQLIDFWNKEIRRVQLAMGFAKPAKVIFDHMILTDSQSELGLMIQLADRDLISHESLLEKFKQNPEIEKIRVRKEARDRFKDIDPPKASPYHNPDKEHDLAKIFAQRGAYSPSEFGLELQPRKEGEETFMEIQGSQQQKMKQFSPTGRVDDGRPKGSGDKQKRKNREFSPQTNAEIANTIVWAGEAYKAISKLVVPFVLDNYGKKNVRSLTIVEKSKMEETIARTLCGLVPHQDLSDEDIYNSAYFALVNKDIYSTYDKAYSIFNRLLQDVKTNSNRDLSIDELRSLFCAAYSLSMIEE